MADTGTASSPAAYPLAWPPGWPRTIGRQKGVYRTSLAGALGNLRAELERLCGTTAARTLVLSSNVTLGADNPADPGVVAYLTRDGQQIAIPCDRWNHVEHNVQAIALTIEAMRAMERHGAAARRRIDGGERGEEVAKELGISRNALYKRFARCS